MKEITFTTKKENHNYAVRNTDGHLELVKEPEIGKKYYEFAVVAGGNITEEETTHYKPILLEIPIPLCNNHNNKEQEFLVHTCNNWHYICIPSKLGSMTCRLCKTDLTQPQPYLINADLRYADLRYANLRYANLSNADLNSANLSNADLNSANLSNADLNSANLSNANLSNADLNSANLRYADLRYANLNSANLRYADLRYANLRYANLRYANLSNTRYNDTTRGLSKEQLKVMINIT